MIEEGVTESPFQVELYQFASESAYHLHDIASAENQLLKALELGEKTSESHLTLGNLYVTEERSEEVITILNDLEEMDHPYAEWNLAEAYNELEDFAVAKIHYKQAAQKSSYEPEFLKECALFLREEDELEKAKHLLYHYLKHEPGGVDVQSVLINTEERQETTMFVSLPGRKKFLTRLVNTAPFERREILWILNYLLTHDATSSNVHFVENIERADQGIRVVVDGLGKEPLLLFVQAQEFTNPE